MMAGLATFLINIAGSIAGRAMIALGFGLVSYLGYSQIIDQILSAINQQLSTIPSEIFQIVMLAGMGDVIGIILGAYTSKAVLLTIRKYRPMNPVNYNPF